MPPWETPRDAPWMNAPLADRAQWRRRPESARARLIIPAVVAFLVQVPASLWQAAHQTELWFGALIVIGALIGPVALLMARRWPGIVVAVCAAAAVIDVLIDPVLPFGPPPVALFFAVVLAIVRGARVWALASLGAGLVVVLAVALSTDAEWRPARVLGVSLALLVAVGVGEAMRTRREGLERYRASVQVRRQTAEQAERVRIARELHDVLAHSLSSINVQAGMGLHLLESRPDRAGEALAAIKAASKDALDEVRSMIGVLRSDDDGDGAPRRPEPGLDRIGELAEPARASGIEVEIIERVGARPSAATQLALYRIVQESLTNVVRHSGASRVVVQMIDTGDAIELTVDDDGSVTVDPSRVEGSGLLGMAERTALLGGDFDAGPRAAGGFRVRAVLPRGAGG